MSPAKFQDSDVTKGVINGPRPMPLRINKDSHMIHKPPSNPSSHQSATDATSAVKNHGQSAARRHQPVIIYTHSPKVIHANASDFMALVQKLTGLTRAEEGEGDRAAKSEAMKEEDSYSDEKDCSVNNNNNLGYVENSETTSVLADDQRFMCDVKQDSTAVSHMYKMSNAFLVDAPLFTPNSNEFFCSSRPISLFPTPNMAATSISPSFMDYMKAFPDY